MDTVGPIYSILASEPDYADLVQDFVDDIPNKCKAIEDLLAVGDTPHLHRIIHQLSGSCGGYGFPTITEAAIEIDVALKAGESIERIKPQIDSLLSLLKRARTTPTQS